MRRALAMALLLLPALAGAEPYSIDQAVAYALAHNPELRAAAASRSAAAAQAQATASGRQPEINLRYMLRRSDNPLDAFADELNTRSIDPGDFDPARLNDPDPSTLHATELSLLWPVYTGGRIGADIAAAGAQQSAAELQYRRARETIAYRTRAAYLAAQAAQEAVSIMNDAVQAAERHAATTARLLRQRRIVRSDNLTADVNLALVRSNREQAQTRARQALTQVKLVMGLAPGAAIELGRWMEAETLSAVLSVDELIARAESQRADVRAAAAAHEAAQSRVRATRAAYAPEVSLGAAQSWYDDRLDLDNASTSVMGVVRMNLYNGGRTAHLVTAAVEEAGAAEARLTAVKQQAAGDVQSAAIAVDQARERVVICADNVGKARQTVELVQGRYGEGRTILIDLLQAERALVEARMEKVNALLDLRTARTALAYAVGTLEAAP